MSDSNKKDETPITLTSQQFKELLNVVRSRITREDLEDILKDHSNLTESELSAIKKAVHEETRSKEATFKTDKRNAEKKWGAAATVLYWMKARVPDYNLTNFIIKNVIITTTAAVSVALTANMISEKLNRTEMGEIKAKSPATTINSGTYSPEIGQGSYIFIGNALSEGLSKEGSIGYGYSNPGGATYNYFSLAESGNELHLSLVEPIVADNYAESSPNKSQLDAHMKDYAVLVKKINIEECAWSASPVYTSYTDIIKDLEDGKEINLAWQWNGTGSDFAREMIHSSFLADYHDQINLVHTQNNVDMLQKLKSGTVDLAVFTEAAGTFDGDVTGTLRKVTSMSNVNLVDLDPSKLPMKNKKGEARASLQYTFKTLSVPTDLATWSNAPAHSKPLNTMCNDYIGLYGRKPSSIDSIGKSMAVTRLHDSVRDIDIVEATGYEAFPEIVKKAPAAVPPAKVMALK